MNTCFVWKPGNKTIVRFCERCGRTWLVTELRDILHNSHFVYTWSEVLEEDEAREKLVEADEPRPRAEKYELKACPDAGVEHRLNSVCAGSSWLVGSLARVAH